MTGIEFTGGAAIRNNFVMNNVAMRGKGHSSDYEVNMYTIHLATTTTSNNIITNNIILGKTITVNGGSSNFINSNIS